MTTFPTLPLLARRTPRREQLKQYVRLQERSVRSCSTKVSSILCKSNLDAPALRVPPFATLPSENHFFLSEANRPIVDPDGRKERVQFDKITARVSRLCYGLDPEHIDAAAITQKVISGVYQGVTTVELDNLVSRRAMDGSQY